MELMNVGIYVRSSISEQTAHQLDALRAFATARGWQAIEYIDEGLSGATEHRPALDALLAAARARRIDVIICAGLDRIARSPRYLAALAAELKRLGVEIMVLDRATAL